LVRLECGHSSIVKVSHIEESALKSFKSQKGKTLFPFQELGVDFLERNSFRCIIGDEMGLGKTIQYLVALYLNRAKVLPALLVVKNGLKRQLELDLHDIAGEIELVPGMKMAMCQTIEGSKQKVFKYPWTIISYDTLARIDKPEEMFPFIKTIVLDECQYIKNEDAKRTNAIRRLVHKVGIENVIGVSGTPIKNRAEEFFPILNLVAPMKFPSISVMMNRYFNYYSDMRTGKPIIINAKPAFYEALEDIMIRRTREEVAPELPKVNRMFFNSEIENKHLRMSYKQVQDEFEKFMDEVETSGNKSGMEITTSLLGFFARMRRITGQAKIEPVVDFVTNFLLSTERKLVIFGHHKETLDALKEVLDTWCVQGGWNKTLQLKSELSADERQEVVTKFKNEAKSRILIASTLASGEGLNLQFCSDAIMMERQWNPANEEQAETRFTRFGSEASIVNITYMISVGTIDEWLTELIENKRALMQNVVDGKDVDWNESSLMKELASVIYAKGGKRWTY
jgi:SWI/SNF-related matrix-associated actin-dependent regulator 1 of chromatin subfamily A